MTTPTLWLDGPQAEGLTPDGGCTFPASPGLHVVIGKNNSGKSRLLRALQTAPVRVELDEVPLPNNPNAINIAANAGLRAPMTVFVSRDLVHVVGDGRQDMEVAERFFASKEQGERLINTRELRADFVSTIRQRVTFRRSHLVPTNRMFDVKAELVDGDPLPFRPDAWPPGRWVALLEALKSHKDEAPREAFKKITEHFASITEGLSLSLDGARTRTLNVLEGKSRHSIADCGDGLRDILGILIYVLLAPQHDVFIEEPGIRLHHGAQKRLLEFLEQSSTERAIWITSHDSPYVFARGVVSRFITTKTDDRTIVVKRSASPKEHQECLRELGWEPAMAAIADAVIYCEGPSDKIAFEGALLNEAKRVVAFPLGGSSAVTDDRQWDKLIARIKSTTELLPHITQKVVLDQDNEPEKRTKLCERLAAAGIAAGFLPKTLLESYWVGDEFPRVVDEIAKEVARRSGAERQAEVQAAIQAASNESHDKHRLRDAVDAVLPAAFSEQTAAEAALRAAPTSVGQLAADLRSLLGWG
jgi:hypothetical protein